MKILIRIAMVSALLVMGFAAGFPMGRNIGFSTGSEWALIQAEIFARESGMFMPVHLEEGKFRVTYKQPPNLHARAWQLADKHYDKAIYPKKCENTITERSRITRTVYSAQRNAIKPVVSVVSNEEPSLVGDNLIQTEPEQSVEENSTL